MRFSRLESVRGRERSGNEVEGERKIKKSEERSGPWIVINAQSNKNECGVCPRRRSYDRPRERRRLTPFPSRFRLSGGL